MRLWASTSSACPPDGPPGAIEIVPAGCAHPLSYELRNRLTAQLGGRRRFKLLPPSETSRLYESAPRFSEIADLDGPSVSLVDHPLLEKARVYSVVLEPGEMLFLPLGWWRQWVAEGISASLDYEAFRWPNGPATPFPGPPG